jgi:chromosome segregation ATPase
LALCEIMADREAVTKYLADLKVTLADAGRTAGQEIVDAEARKLDQRAADLDRRAAELQQLAAELDARAAEGAEIARRVRGLDEREAALTQREAALQERADRVFQHAADLEVKEKDLDRRFLVQSARRLAAVRRLSCPPASVRRSISLGAPFILRANAPD